MIERARERKSQNKETKSNQTDRERGNENEWMLFSVKFVYICHQLIAAHKSSVIFSRFDAYLETYAKINKKDSEYFDSPYCCEFNFIAITMSGKI